MEGREKKSRAERNRLWDQIMRFWECPGTVFEMATEHTRKYPENVAGWLALANALTGMARYDAAHRALTHAQKICPRERMDAIYVQRGRLYDQSCDLKRAEKWYRRAVKAKPTTWKLVFLGAVLAKQGRFAEAKKCHQRAANLGSDEAYLNLGLIFRAERQYRKALRCFESALKLDPAYKEAKEARADVLRAMEHRGGVE